MLTLSEPMSQFVQEVFLAVVGTKRRDGTVRMNPVWFEYDAGSFWLNSWRGSRWLAHLERERDITLLLLDPRNGGRWAQVQGRLVSATTEGADEHIDRLAHRYTGRPYQPWRAGVQRVKIQIEPLRITGPLA
ncbi:MAG TPA: pyridoxamine 5'-phosphate oxidase family protein [Ktedonobacterales bacterium]